MHRRAFEEEIFFVHPHGLYIDGAQTALPGLRMIVDTGHASTIAMLEDEKIAERIPSGSLLLVLKTAPKIEHLAAERGWVLVAPSSALNRRFENKLTIASEFLAVGLPSIEHIIVAPVETSWAVLAGRFGERIVVQEARGHAGEGTRLLTSLADFALLKEREGHPMKFSPFLSGETWTLNGVVGGAGVLVSRPCLQLPNPDGSLGSYGNASKPIDDDLALDIMKHTIRFGEHMGREGYRGWFGLDVLVHDGHIRGFIECNPRLTASAGIFTEMQVEAGQTPFILLHVLEHLDRTYPMDVLHELRLLADGFRESHAVLREATMRASGIYDTAWRRLRDGAWADLGEGETLVRSRSIPGSPSAICISRGNILDVL